MGPEQEQLPIQATGIVGSTTTASAAAVTWIEQANAIVDLAAGVVAVLAGVCTITWYIYRFYKLRGGANDQTNSRK